MNQQNQENNLYPQPLDLVHCEWKAYLQWGHAASPLNDGRFDESKIGVILPEEVPAQID